MSTNIQKFTLKCPICEEKHQYLVEPKHIHRYEKTFECTNTNKKFQASIIEFETIYMGAFDIKKI